MKMLKLLQEIQGLAQFINQRPSARSIGPLMLRSPIWRNPAIDGRRTLKIAMQEPADIPRRVRIIHLRPPPSTGLTGQL